MELKNILFILGTRPEAIKLAPLWHAFKKNGNQYNVKVCSTGQHKEMLIPILDFFGIVPDYELNIMEANQTLFQVTSKGLEGLESVLNDSNPEIIFVQGDTASAFIGALAGFYQKIKVAHIEAGLRTNNKYSPFPEEINRVLVDHLADYHFAPTEIARNNLIRENINQHVWIVGNTVIDALFLTLKIIKKNKKIEDQILIFFKNVISDWVKVAESKIILVTAHRRESFGTPFYNICKALRIIADLYSDIHIIYPVHLNPNVRKPVFEVLDGIENIHLIKPLDYKKMIWLMQKSFLVLTDSGGIQEEAPSLGKPVLVMREVTERMEGIVAGTAKLVGSDTEKIVRATKFLIEDRAGYEKMSKAVNPYGDGKSSMRIINLLESLQNVNSD